MRSVESTYKLQGLEIEYSLASPNFLAQSKPIVSKTPLPPMVTSERSLARRNVKNILVPNQGKDCREEEAPKTRDKTRAVPRRNRAVFNVRSREDDHTLVCFCRTYFQTDSSIRSGCSRAHKPSAICHNVQPST